ncbi:hypothetical protein LWC34_08290 [Kibdelosporangium philippinense]|uniref:DUF2530 domain-containing protein n=1 Tax=Kibdelosporangium philippinense TaxID=211113 RepID=A0ABS8Z4I0_9PSEU|nr:hypothetical protein [Kibdelosporangium philippinense]MCE7002828.1 hypothetical protein [Kibdelosporangium philippinense]
MEEWLARLQFGSRGRYALTMGLFMTALLWVLWLIAALAVKPEHLIYAVASGVGAGFGVFLGHGKLRLFRPA